MDIYLNEEEIVRIFHGKNKFTKVQAGEFKLVKDIPGKIEQDFNKDDYFTRASTMIIKNKEGQKYQGYCTESGPEDSLVVDSGSFFSPIKG